MNQDWQKTPSGKIRARGLGIPFDGEPGPWNAITDVAGVRVGYSTLISGEGPLKVGEGPVRTGVTAILPRSGADLLTPLMAGVHSLNGNGEMTGFVWIEEAGELIGPITITNTHSCGVTRDAAIQWMKRHDDGRMRDFSLPVSAETYDGELNDINGFHVTAEHAFEAMDGAVSGPLELGSLGGGTGMICFDFKGGNGTASRLVNCAGEDYTLGLFVQANFGIRRELTIAGIPVGAAMPGGEIRSDPGGSIIAVVATDAPLLPHQLKRVARRVSLGLARTGSIAHHGSGDIFLAFSTANQQAFDAGKGPRSGTFLANAALNPLFAATVQATEEAVIDAMIVNETMVGRDNVTVRALPHQRLQELLAHHRRLEDASSS